MSNDSINLVSTKNEQVNRELKILLFTRVIAVTLLITVATVSIIAFFLAATNPLSKIKQDENNTIASIASLHDKLTSYYLIKDRINNITNLEISRKDYTSAIDLLLSQVGSEMQITRFSVEKNIITLEVSSSSLVPLNQTIDNVLEFSRQGKVIKNVKLSSLNLNAITGQYSLVLEAEAN